MNKQGNTELYLDYEDYHVKGDDNCIACMLGYPIYCKCNGVIHAESEGYETGNMNHFSVVGKIECDRCGANYEAL